MRSIGSIEHENTARRFSAYLTKQKIEHSIDANFDHNTATPEYSIWIHNEDQLKDAAAYFQAFQQNPSSAEFDVPLDAQIAAADDAPPEEAIPQEEPRKIPRATFLAIALCFLIFFISAMQEIPLIEKGLTDQSAMLTPIQVELLYDVPPAVDAIEAEIEQAPLGQPLSPDLKADMAAAQQSTYFRGLYEWIVLSATGKNASEAFGPLFYKIRQGQIWRLFSPCLLHAGLLHIGFNMIWVWVLGKQIEQRIGISKYLLLTLLTGIFANTVQYLVSGPFFLGYSGIVMALAGFIWSREKIAPWEGYPLRKPILIFLVLFVLAMFALQLGSFILIVFTKVNFTPNIANAAHIAGAIFGAFLGRLSFFSAKGAR